LFFPSPSSYNPSLPPDTVRRELTCSSLPSHSLDITGSKVIGNIFHRSRFEIDLSFFWGLFLFSTPRYSQEVFVRTFLFPRRFFDGEFMWRKVQSGAQDLGSQFPAKSFVDRIVSLRASATDLPDQPKIVRLLPYLLILRVTD